MSDEEDIVDLLSQLDTINEELAIPKVSSPEPIESEPLPEISDPEISDPPVTNEGSDTVTLVAGEAIVPVETLAPPDLLTDVQLPIPPENIADPKFYLDKMNSVTDEILLSCKSDRQEAQQIIDSFRDKIENIPNGSRMYVDGLVKMVEVKAGINMTAVKIIETNAKMLAALKAGVSINNNVNNKINAGPNDKELNEILSRPLTGADEY